jgi:hypothetical protein
LAAGLLAQIPHGETETRRPKPEKDEAHIPESWSPDGRYLSYAVLKNGWYTLWTLSLTDGTTERFGEVESSEPIGSVFAPIGGWIAYHELPRGASPLTSSSGVYVAPFPPTGTRYQAPKIQRDYQPVWASNGTELLYVGAAVSGQLVAVPVTTKGWRWLRDADALPVHARCEPALRDDPRIRRTTGRTIGRADCWSP